MHPTGGGEGKTTSVVLAALVVIVIILLLVFSGRKGPETWVWRGPPSSPGPIALYSEPSGGGQLVCRLVRC